MLRICDSIPEVVQSLEQDTACILSISSTSEVSEVLRDGWQAAINFFNMPDAIKKLAGPLNDKGYTKLSEGKEMYTINVVNDLRNPPFPWPLMGEELEEKSLSSFWSLHNITRSITDVIDEVSSQTKSEFLQEREAFLNNKPTELHNNSDYSESTLFLRSYSLPSNSITSESSERCRAHTDSSFITALPLTRNSSGLQVYIRKSNSWLAIPPNVISSNDTISHLLIMSGEALAEETNSKYLAAVHRVVLESSDVVERVTTPFQLRAASKFSSGLSATTVLM